MQHLTQGEIAKITDTDIDFSSRVWTQLRAIEVIARNAERGINDPASYGATASTLIALCGEIKVICLEWERFGNIKRAGERS